MNPRDVQLYDTFFLFFVEKPLPAEFWSKTYRYIEILLFSCVSFQKPISKFVVIQTLWPRKLRERKTMHRNCRINFSFFFAAI